MTDINTGAKNNFLELLNTLTVNIAKVIVGKKTTSEMLLVSLLAGGHVLLDDVPGVGKTLLARSLAKSVGGSFKRIQFPPDLLPADITGFNIYDRQTGQFKFQAGPVMANILLADEINRAIPRTQSSLLESMEEGQVTVDGDTYDLPRPFMVIATQNPVELEGTFPLPEAQMDRFLLRLDMGYPTFDDECSILDLFQSNEPIADLEPVVTLNQVTAMQEDRRQIVVSAPVKQYIVSLTSATREISFLRLGASPRASLHLMRTAQALAMIRGRDYVIPDDVKKLAVPVLAHRLLVDAKETVRGTTPEGIIENIINDTTVPPDSETR